MLYTKIQPQSFLVLEKKCFTIYGHSSHLEPFDQIVNIEGHVWNLMKIVQEVKIRRPLKISQFYMYTARGMGR